MKITLLLLLSTTLLMYSGAAVIADNHDQLTERDRHNLYDDVVRQNWYDNVAGEGGSIDIVCVGWSEYDQYFGHIMVFTFDGSSLNVEDDNLFQVNDMETVAHGVDMGDVDGDGVNEIAVTGYAWDDEQNQYAWLQIYEWDGTTLTLVDSVWWGGMWYGEFYWGLSYSVKIGDLNGHGLNEIVTCGATAVDDHVESELNVWSFNTELQLQDDVSWSNSEGFWSIAESVALETLNGDMKIVTGGYFDDADETDVADLNVWSFNSELTLEANEVWGSVGDAVIHGVFVKNGKIYTAGMANDGTRDQGQLSVWEWGSLTLEDRIEWYTVGDTVARDVFVTDVDYDGVYDVITVGWENDTADVNAQLNIWNLDFTLKDSEEWFEMDHTRLLSVYVMNVNDNDEKEIITAGHMGDFLAKQTTVWSYPAPEEPEPTPPPSPGGGIPGFPLEGLIVGMVATALAMYFFRKRTTQGTPMTF